MEELGSCRRIESQKSTPTLPDNVQWPTSTNSALSSLYPYKNLGFDFSINNITKLAINPVIELNTEALMSISRIQGLPLEVAVVACYNLDDNHWISKQNPFVTIEYGNIKYRTKQCKDGRRNPTFQEKFIFTFVDEIQELIITVWNYNKINEQLGTGRVLLHKVISQGFQDASWALQSRDGKHAGEIRLILRFPHANKQKLKLDSAPTKTLGQLLESSPRGADTAPLYTPPSACCYYTGRWSGYPPPNTTTNSPPNSPYPCAGYPPPNTTNSPPNSTYPCTGYRYPPSPTYPPPAQLSICYPTGLSVYPPPVPVGIYPPPPPPY